MSQRLEDNANMQVILGHPGSELYAKDHNRLSREPTLNQLCLKTKKKG